MSFTLPEDILKSLKCSLCTKYLSVSPIYYAADGKYRCGRCSFIKFESALDGNRATLFETVASTMIFPCSFKECDMQLPWGEVHKHESSCPKRVMVCPETNCNVELRLEQLTTHCKEVHVFQNGSFKSRECLNEKGLCRSFIVSDNDNLYLLYDYVNDTICAFTLFCFDQENSTNVFNLKIKSAASTINFTDQEITLYNDAEHCAECLLKKCSSKFHKYSKLYGDHNLINSMTHMINKISLKDILSSENIQYIITIKEKSETDETAATSKDNHITNNNFVLRQILECQICNYFLTPPIFICETGHTVCKKCKSKLTKCPSCDKVFSSKNTRNFSLEELVDRVDLPCQNSDIGCDFVGNVEDLQAHESECDIYLGGL